MILLHYSSTLLMARSIKRIVSKTLSDPARMTRHRIRTARAYEDVWQGRQEVTR